MTGELLLGKFISFLFFSFAIFFTYKHWVEYKKLDKEEKKNKKLYHTIIFVRQITAITGAILFGLFFWLDVILYPVLVMLNFFGKL